jgi:hypothetical protein
VTDDAFISRFESGAIQPADFHHADHVRLAFSYLKSHSVIESIRRFSASLKQFAEMHGKTGLYHETITWAYLLLIHERMARSRNVQEWDEFAAGNPDLLVWKSGILARYYKEETLRSELARKVFLFPDRIRED